MPQNSANWSIENHSSNFDSFKTLSPQDLPWLCRNEFEKKTVDCRDIISNQFTLERTKITGMAISLSLWIYLGFSVIDNNQESFISLIAGYVRYTQEIQKKTCSDNLMKIDTISMWILKSCKNLQILHLWFQNMANV